MKEPIGDTGWSFPFPEGSPLYIERDKDSASVELYSPDETDICIEHEVQAGYSGGTTNERIHVPVQVILELLRRAGRIP